MKKLPIGWTWLKCIVCFILSVLPAYIDLLKTITPDEALDDALALVNNVSKKRLLNNVSSAETTIVRNGT